MTTPAAPSTIQPDNTGIGALKAALRAEMLARRAAIAPALRQAAVAGLATHADGLGDVTDVVVAGFSPIRGEIDPFALMETLHRRGARVALPALDGDRLVFRRWRPGDRLVPAPFGTAEPAADAEAVAPAVLLVPLLAFDRAGGRLGYGKAFYDRAIAELAEKGPVRAVGVAFALQEAAEVPMENHDRRLDLVLTECEAIVCAAAAAG